MNRNVAAEPRTKLTQVDVRFVDSLPGGRAVMPVEEDGCFVWLFVRGHVSPQAAHEMADDINYLIRAGLWRQDWQPPQTRD